MGHPTWIYHKIEEPKLVDSDETKNYYTLGWADSPAVFITFEAQEVMVQAKAKAGEGKGKKGRK